jgi:hypothetical protein
VGFGVRQKDALGVCHIFGIFGRGERQSENSAVRAGMCLARKIRFKFSKAKAYFPKY